jgi:hypothetical protein
MKGTRRRCIKSRPTIASATDNTTTRRPKRRVLI